MLKSSKNTKETKTEKTIETPVETKTNYINEVYYGFEDNTAINYHARVVLTLFNDGTYYLVPIDSEPAKGTYEINGNNLTLHNSRTEGPSTGDTNYEITNDKTQIKASTGFTMNKM